MKSLPTLVLVALALTACAAPQSRSIGYTLDEAKAVAPKSSLNEPPSAETLAAADFGVPPADDYEVQVEAGANVAVGLPAISASPEPQARNVSEREAFVQRISSMPDQELWEFGRQRRDAMSETLRLTGKLELPKWDDLYTAEGTKREKALMLPTEELAALSKPELEARILATEGIPFVARLLQQLERAHGSSRASLKYAKETARKTAELERKTADAEAARLAAIQRAGFSPEVTAKLNARKAWIGMTDAQVRMSWGEPGTINTTITKEGRSEQWVYGSGRFASYVYVQDGVVTALQL